MGSLVLVLVELRGHERGPVGAANVVLGFGFGPLLLLMHPQAADDSPAPKRSMGEASRCVVVGCVGWVCAY